jgi:hypothetical protein
VTNGNLIAGPVTNSATGVTNGLFAVTLDFGPGVFTGPARWLEVDVRTNGSGAFTNLSPCQPLTPVPYALYAQTSSGTNGTLAGSSITLGSGGNSWDIGVVNNALTFSYGDPLVTLTNTQDGSLGVPNNITAGGKITADGGLRIGGTTWNVSVGTGSFPNNNSLNNSLVFSASGLPCLDMVYAGSRPVVWAPGWFGAMEVDTSEMIVTDDFRNSLVSIDSESGIVVSDADGNTLAQIDSQGNITANGDVEANGDFNAMGNFNGPNLFLGYGGNASPQINFKGGSGINSDGAGGLFINFTTMLNVNSGLIEASGTDVVVHGSLSADNFGQGSDRNLKEKFTPIDNQEILERVASLPISRWNFKTDEQTPHIGPMAQDFYTAFKVGADDKHITTVDEGGVALAAIQGLNQKLNEKDAEIQGLKQSVAELKAMVEKLAGK